VSDSTRTLVGVRLLVYLYLRRLRVHATQELLAGVGVSIAVALVFAVVAASSSITSSASEVVRTVTGPAKLQLRARGPEGFTERDLPRVERLPGVVEAAPLLEQPASLIAPAGKRVTVTIAGATPSLPRLDGLSATLPSKAFAYNGIDLSETTAKALGITRRSLMGHVSVVVELRGRSTLLPVSAVLGPEAAGALAQAQIAIMSLQILQELAGMPGRISRILVQSERGREPAVSDELRSLAAGRINVAPSNQDVAVLHQALQPGNQASDLFAGLSGLLGFLLAFNAMLLTVPERREAIADLRLDGAAHGTIVQMVLFEAVCLGILASAVGLVGGYLLALGVFHQPSPGYLTQAFTLGTSVHIGVEPVVLALGGGVVAMCLASLIPLLDLRSRRTIDAVFSEREQAGVLTTGVQRRLMLPALVLLLVAGGLFAWLPRAALFSCVLLALATVLAVPAALGGILRLSRRLGSNGRILPLALSSLQATTLRSLALVATGAVALFGSVALGGSRDDLLGGLHAFARTYVDDASIWVLNPHDTAGTNTFQQDHHQTRIRSLPGVANVEAFQSEFATMGSRRIWLIARPANASTALLKSQIIEGSPTTTAARMRAGGWIAVSKQVADERHAQLGGTISLPSPAGTASFKLAAITTNFGWTSGVIVMSVRDYAQYWETNAPTALGVQLDPDTPVAPLVRKIADVLGPTSGLEAISAPTREHRFDDIAGEGLAQLGEISYLLIAAAILAMAAALGSSLWQRRQSLAEMRLDGASRSQMRLVLLCEAALLLSAGCVTGALAGICGQFVIDGYLKHVTGFPVAGVATGGRPLELFALVVVAVLLIVSVPAWFASRVPARLALGE
jgi:putative ABC transport system permease protein